MSLDCGQDIGVKDQLGTRSVRFVAQCGGRFLLISHLLEPRNGYMLPDWRSVIRELVAMTVPAPLRYEKGKRAESMADGMYHDLDLSYPLSIKGLADLLGEDAGEVEALLKDLAVQAE